jgi:hypothetical protein
VVDRLRAALALIVSEGSINILAFAVFLKPVTEDLSIGRGAFSSGMTLGTVLLSPARLPDGSSTGTGFARSCCSDRPLRDRHGAMGLLQ